MDSVQTMRWILVWASAASALVSFILGYWQAGAVLLLGVLAHTVHWYFHFYKPRQRTAPEEPAGE